MSSIKEKPLWQWILLLIAGLFLSILGYGFAAIPGEFMHGWGAWVLNVVAAAVLLLLYALFVHAFESPSWPKDLKMRKCLSHTGLGLAVGLLVFVLIVGVMMLSGLYKITGSGADAKGLADAFFLFLVVAVGEEVIFRGVLFRWIDERWGFWVALAVSSLVFGLVHISNSNATLWSSVAIALEAGLLLGAAYKWAGSLWFPIGIHWAWNFSQGNIFGFAVSGNEAGASLLRADVTGPDWLTGGAFGAEASVIATVLGVALAAWFIWKVRERKAASE